MVYDPLLYLNSQFDAADGGGAVNPDGTPNFLFYQQATNVLQPNLLFVPQEEAFPEPAFPGESESTGGDLEPHEREEDQIVGRDSDGAPTLETVTVRETGHANQCRPDLLERGRPLGCDRLSSGTNVYTHRNVEFLQREDGTSANKGGIQIGPARDLDGRLGLNQAAKIGRYGNYSEELYRQPNGAFASERRISLGVLTNSWTGEMYEAFENDLPPPNTDKSLLPSRYEHSNPRLIWANGGIDPQNPLPRRVEVCKRIPGADGGNNRWGDQLFEDRRRLEIKDRVARELYSNRHGDKPVEPVWDRKPVGFVGYQQAYRAKPYLPPTQELDTGEWVGAPEPTFVPRNQPDRLLGRVTVRKSNLQQCPQTFGVHGAAGQVAPMLQQRDPVRGTLRSMMETTFPVEGANAEGTGDRSPHGNVTVLSQPLAPLPSHGASVEGAGEQLPHQDPPRATLRSMMEESFPVEGANVERSGDRSPHGNVTVLAQQLGSPEVLNAVVSGSGNVPSGSYVDNASARAPIDWDRKDVQHRHTGLAGLPGAGALEHWADTPRETLNDYVVRVPKPIFGVSGDAATAGSSGVPTVGEATHELNYRGVQSTSDYVSLSKEPAGTGGWTYMHQGYADHETQRGQMFRRPNPGRASLNNPLMPGVVQFNCRRPDDPNVTYFDRRGTGYVYAPGIPVL